MNSRNRFDVHAGGRRQDLSPRSAPSDSQGCHRRPRRPDHGVRDQAEHDCKDQNRRRGAPQEPGQGRRAALDPRAEEVGGARPQHAAGRDGIAPVAPSGRPGQGLGPLLLQVRSRRAVEEGLLQLTPASLERDPRESAGCRLWIARDRPDHRPELAVRARRVVAAHARLGGAADVESRRVLVRMGARRGIDDRVRAVDDLELRVAPFRPLGALVRAVADLVRVVRGEGRGRVRPREVELDHLPVALVLVVEVVERIEDPVLEGDLVAVGGIARDVGVDGRLGPLRDAPRPELVGAARVERAPREVEVVLVETGDVVRRRADLHEVGGIPRAAQGDCPVTEEDVHVRRLERLAGPALLRLVDEADDGRVPIRKRLLVLEVGVRSDREGEHGQDAAGDCGRETTAHRRRSSHTPRWLDRVRRIAATDPPRDVLAAHGKHAASREPHPTRDLVGVQVTSGSWRRRRRTCPRCPTPARRAV